MCWGPAMVKRPLDLEEEFKSKDVRVDCTPNASRKRAKTTVLQKEQEEQLGP